ncbi:MAG: thymidine phosphorylase, partial [Bacilli bacterium]
MRAVDLIIKKKNGGTLTREEIKFLIKGYVDGRIPDYQMSSLLMAICFQGMNEQEQSDLTLEMLLSGERIDLSSINGICVDKHSTGGVGDKTTLVVAPLAAACGLKMAKMSGRGLGHTGGTLDKLEAIPNFRIALSPRDFFRQVEEISLAVAGQTANIAPADKKLYALRDVTGTVEAVGLIASSIMSKKLASGATHILLDVKVGDGAFMKDLDSARE